MDKHNEIDITDETINPDDANRHEKEMIRAALAEMGGAARKAVHSFDASGNLLLPREKEDLLERRRSGVPQ